VLELVFNGVLATTHHLFFEGLQRMSFFGQDTF
jgi:hypothetical protein